MRYSFDTAATRKRLTYASSKSTYGSDSTIYGFFTPTGNDQRAVALGIMDQAYSFFCDGTEDIQASDILVISSQNYGVRGVRRFTQKRQDFLECILEKSVNKS